MIDLIIAECGQNHCGDMSLARKLIDEAYLNGADLCKFQLYDHNILYKKHPEIPDIELSFAQARMLFDYGKGKGIEVFFSVFDVEKVKWCEAIGVSKYKIAYSQRNNQELIDSIPQDKDLFISTDNYTALEWALYCVPEYPTPVEHLDFRNLRFFDGYSDHTIGIDVAKIAIARGAKIMEKHFAIDYETGIDAPWSMTPKDLREVKEWELKVSKIL